MRTLTLLVAYYAAPKAAPTPTPSPTVKPTKAPPTAAPVTEQPATVVPPQIDTPPATTAVSSATSPPVTTTPTPAPATGSDGAQATGAGRPNSVQNNPTSSSNSIADSASTAASGTSSITTSPSTTDRSASMIDSSKVSTSAPSPSAQVMDASNGISSKKSSSLYVNIGVIVAAVAGVAIVAIFIVRRIKRHRDSGFLKTPEEGQKQFNLQVDRSTPGNGARGAGAAAAGAGFSVAGGGINGTAVAARGRRASSSSDAPSLLSMASLNSSTVEFANQHPPYGLPSQFGLPSEASSYARSSSASYTSSTVSSAAASGGFAQAARAPPPSRPQAIQEGDEFTLYSKRKQSVGTAVTPGGKSARPVHKPIYHESVHRMPSAISHLSGNTYEVEYDIVHPRALQDADRRNTETLVMDGRFQSNFSERDVRSVREDRFFATKEHEI